MTAKVLHADLWGKRESKYSQLLQSDVTMTEWARASPTSPSYLFVPQKQELAAEYERAWKVTDIFPLNGVGMTTARDHLVIDFETQPILQRVRVFRDSSEPDAELCRGLDIPMKKGWNIPNARAMIRRERDLARHVKPLLYRPFDRRLIFYHDSLVWRTVRRVMLHMLAANNVALVWTRPMSPRFDFSVTVTEIPVDQCAAGNKSAGCGISYMGPLYLLPQAARADLGDTSDSSASGVRRPNLDPEFVAEMEKRLGLKFVSDGLGELRTTFEPEDVFHYIYAIFHSPTYRKRYAEFLRRDFPRVPLTSDLHLFRQLCCKGADLVALHLMESDYPAASWNRAQPRGASPFEALLTRFPVRGDDVVENVFYLAPGEPEPGTGKPLPAGTGRVYISKDRPKEGKKGQYFEGVPPQVWQFHIGGYQVCQKWLKDRKGRVLTYDDLTHYQRIVSALGETIRLMAEIDQVIDAHGGWPIR